MKPTNPPLRYYGGKWKIAKWIISHFPQHDSYIEPFGGGAGVLLRKAPSWIEVYNDINRDVVNFFKVLRERPEELARVLELTPYSRWEYTHIREGYEQAGELEQARRFFISSNMGRGRGGKLEEGGWQFSVRKSYSRTTLEGYNKMIDQLMAAAERMRGVYIECDDALKVIERYDDPKALFYIDPPYLAETRCMRWRSDGYIHEYRNDDHRRLADVLHQVKGSVVLSGYPSPMYQEMYGDWAAYSKQTVKQNGTRGVENIWTNNKVIQLNFF